MVGEKGLNSMGLGIYTWTMIKFVLYFIYNPQNLIFAMIHRLMHTTNMFVSLSCSMFFLYKFVCASVCLCLYVSLWLSFSVCLSVLDCLSVSLCLRLSMSVCLCHSFSICLSVCVCLSVSLSPSIFLCLYACLCLYVSLWLCICMFVCDYMLIYDIHYLSLICDSLSFFSVCLCAFPSISLTSLLCQFQIHLVTYLIILNALHPHTFGWLNILSHEFSIMRKKGKGH